MTFLSSVVFFCFWTLKYPKCKMNPFLDCLFCLFMICILLSSSFYVSYIQFLCCSFTSPNTVQSFSYKFKNLPRVPSGVTLLLQGIFHSRFRDSNVHGLHKVFVIPLDSLTLSHSTHSLPRVPIPLLKRNMRLTLYPPLLPKTSSPDPNVRVRRRLNFVLLFLLVLLV